MKKLWSVLLIMLISVEGQALLFSNNEVVDEPMFSAKVLTKKMISKNTLEVVLKLNDPDDFSYTAGQFIKGYFEKSERDVYKQDDRHIKYFRRSYSIASTFDEIKETGVIKLAISLVDNGLASDWFMQSQPGQELIFRGPMGKLVLPKKKDYERVVLLATGTGIVPYRSIIPELVADTSRKVEIIAGFRNLGQEIYSQEFQELNRHPHINSQVTYSQLREKKTFFGILKNLFAFVRLGDKKDNVLQGYVQSHLKSLNLNPKKDRAYVCGGPEFLKDCGAGLEALGFVNNESYVKENYSWSGHIDKPFTIRSQL